MNQNKLINFLLYITLIISLFAFENNIYKYYNYTQVILFGLLFLTFLLMMRKKEYKNETFKALKNNPVVLILCFLMILNTLISTLVFNNSISSVLYVILYVINIILFFAVLPVHFISNKEFTKKFLKIMNSIVIIVSIFGILLYFNNGMFGYYLEGGRSGSIYFDSNFFALISAISCITVFYDKKKSPITYLKFIICFLAVFYSGSRGTMLSLCLCLIYFIVIKYPNTKLLKKTILLSFLTIGGILFFKNINNISFLRIDQGSHGRAEMIVYALKQMNKSPIIGFGYGSIADVLKSGGFANSNTHNSLVDFLFRYGYICLFLYVIIIIKAFFCSMKDNKKLYINLLLIILLINMNTILYSFGGVGFPSLALSLCLGLSCSRSENYEKKY